MTTSNPVDPENIRLARRALKLYRDGRYRNAFDAVAEISTAWPDSGVGYAMVAWIDMAAFRLRIPHGSAVELDYGCDLPHEHYIPQEDRVWVWTGRLIAARLAWDRETFEALLHALPHDPAIRARHAAAVLHASATAEPVDDRDEDPDTTARRANAALN
jgi:hypothetical protein